jgi:hypothetical protein
VKAAGFSQSAVGLRIVLILRITAGGAKHPPNTLAFDVHKVLPIVAAVRHRLVYPNDTQIITVTTNKGAQLTYRIVYPGGSVKVITRQTSTGTDTLPFVVAFTPPPHAGLEAASVTIDGVPGLVKGRVVTRFVVRRRDAIPIAARGGTPLWAADSK